MNMRPAIVLALSLSLVSYSQASTQPRLMSVRDVTSAQTSVSDRVLAELDKKETRERIRAMGLSPEEARARVAGMTEQEVRDLVSANGPQQAGGDIVISLTTVLLIVIIVLLLR